MDDGLLLRSTERGTRARTCHLSMSAAATPAANVPYK